MVTIADRIAEQRAKKELSAIALSEKLGWPRMSIDRFENGKQTPTKEQQLKLADFFGVSIAYLKGETNDPTRQDSWMDMIIDSQNEPEPQPMPKPKQKAINQENDGGMLDALLLSDTAKQTLKRVVIDTLRSPEAQDIIRKAIRDELKKQK